MKEKNTKENEKGIGVNLCNRCRFRSLKKKKKVQFYSRKRYKKVRLLQNDFIPPVQREEQRRHEDGNTRKEISRLVYWTRSRSFISLTVCIVGAFVSEMYNKRQEKAKVNI